MRISGLLLAAGLIAPSLGLTVRVESEATEDGGSVTARFLQGLANFKPEAFHPFIKQLVDNKYRPSRVELSHVKFQTKKGLDGQKIKSPYTDGSLNPLFTRFLLPNETAALLESQLFRYRHARERGEIELLRFALATGQSDEVVELMHGVARQRDAELASSRNCNSWIDVQGTKACNSVHFWQAVGNDEKRGTSVIKVASGGAPISPLPLDQLFPTTRDTFLPFFVLYATPIDEEFPVLYELLHSLAAPKVGAPRLQFAVRWKQDSKGEQIPKSLPVFAARLDVKEGSVPSLSQADAAQLGLRATAHIMASEDPLAALVSVAARAPVLGSELTASVPEELVDVVKAASLEPSFTINGVAIPFEDIEPYALLRHLRAERPIIQKMQKVNHQLTFKTAREMMLAKGLSPAEEITGGNEKNLVKPTPSNPLRIVDLVDALQDLPNPFVFFSFLDGVDPQTADSEAEDRVDPPAFTTIYVVADLDSAQGLILANEALKYLNNRGGLRVSFVHNPAKLALADHSYRLSTLLHSLIVDGSLKEVFPAELAGFITSEIGSGGPKLPLDEDVWTPENPITPFLNGGATPEQQDAALAFWTAVAPFSERAGIKAGEAALIINGRVVSLGSAPFTIHNFRALHAYELQKRIQPVVNALTANLTEQLAADRGSLAQVASVATSLISRMSLPVGTALRSRPYVGLPADYPSFAASRNEHNSLFEIGVVLDPVSELAQKWAPVIKALAAMPNVYARVFLAPSPHNAPASSIYSSSIRAVTEHGEAQEIVKPSVKFEGLPAEAVVSLSVDVDDWGMVRILGEEVKETKVTDLPSEVVYQFRQGATPDPVPAASDRVKDEL